MMLCMTCPREIENLNLLHATAMKTWMAGTSLDKPGHDGERGAFVAEYFVAAIGVAVAIVFRLATGRYVAGRGTTTVSLTASHAIPHDATLG